MKPIQPISESVLSRIWEEQHFQPDSLKTLDGVEVQVIRRGWRNSDNGPDFKQALIRIEDQVYEGDIELHLTPGDWHAHGHDTDPSYNHTILHVALWPSHQMTHQSSPVCTSSGQKIPTVIVQPCLSKSLDRLIAHFERADEQQQQKIDHCRQTLGRIPPQQILSRLRQLGQERLYKRVQRFKSWIPKGGVNIPNELPNIFQQVLYEAICEGLGYSSNKRPFRELARRLPLQVILTHLPKSTQLNLHDQLLWIQALLFGASGLLPPPGVQTGVYQNTDPETRTYIAELRSLWDMVLPCLDLAPMQPEEWHFFRLRPPNFPTRRLAALSYLLLSYTVQPLFNSYLQLFELFSNHPPPLSKSIRLLEHTLEIPAAGYWKGRYLFGKPVFSEHDRFFLGRSRIRDIIISAVLPVFLLHGRETSQSPLESQIIGLYEIFPSPPWNRMTRSISRQLFAHREELLPDMTASVYQGMLQLYKHYCDFLACSQCPLGCNDCHTETTNEVQEET